MANTKVVSWTASALFREGMEIFAKSDIVARGQRGKRLIAARHAGFLTEHDLYTDPDAERGADPSLQPLQRNIISWGRRVGGTAIPLPNGDAIFLTLERPIARGPVEASIVQQLDALRPHLARSAFMSARLQLERARVASETLALIGLPNREHVSSPNDYGKIRWAGRVAGTDGATVRSPRRTITAVWTCGAGRGKAC